MSIPSKTLPPRGANDDLPNVTPTKRSLAWAELSILEAREMSAEALRIVAKSKDVCRRSDGSAT